MPAVYSFRLAHLYLAPVGTNDLGAPPAGFKWIIKTICVSSYGGSIAAPRSGFDVIDGIGAPIFVVEQPFSVNGCSYDWSGTQTIESGEHVFFRVQETGWSMRMSGYELVLP